MVGVVLTHLERKQSHESGTLVRHHQVKIDLTSGRFWAKTPMNCSVDGLQPCCSSPEPRASALSATWKLGRKKHIRERNRSSSS